ncbi:MAG: hypothetical protein STSR0008_22680 [Ignavibacterium sp.]
MQLIFVDETGDQKNKKYFGLSIAVINSSFYSQIKNNFQKIIKNSTWDVNVEFKGSFLFSASKGDSSITIDQRIDICSDLMKLNKSKINARMKFYYVVKKDCDDQKEAYLKYLPKLLDKALSKAKKGNGKELVSIHCDQRDDISPDEIRSAIQPILNNKKYVLYENVIQSNSGFDTVGVLYADIFGYLFARFDTISNDSDLFDNLTDEQKKSNGKFLKLQSSTKLLELIKEFKAFEVVA